MSNKLAGVSMEEGEQPIKVTIRDVDPMVWRRFRATAVERGVPVGQLLNHALQKWMETQKQIVVHVERRRGGTSGGPITQ